MTDTTAPSIYPVLRYDDVAKAITFLVDAFGFKEVAVHKGPNGEIAHAELSYRNGMVMLGSSAGSSVFDTGPNTVYVVVEDADAHHARAVAAGADVVYPLTDQDYGSRDYAVKDAAGHIWSFGTYQPAVPA